MDSLICIDFEFEGILNISKCGFLDNINITSFFFLSVPYNNPIF